MNDEMTYGPAICRPLVTVITATYNLLASGRAENIRQSLESVHSQTYPNIEHLVIDGASTDGTLELLREYEQKGWVKVHSAPDKGVYDAFNKGIELAQGKYCVFLNSDDFWHDPHGMEMSVHLLEIGRGDFSYAPATYIRPDGVEVYERDPDVGAFFCVVPCNHQTMFYRTELLREYRYDDEHYRLAADYDLTTRMLLSGRKGVFVPLNFTTFREGGISGDSGLHEKELTQIYRRYYGPIIGNEAANGMYQWEVPARLLTSIASLVHPDIVEHMKRNFEVEPGRDAAMVTLRQKNEIPYQLVYDRVEFDKPVIVAQQAFLRLFGVLPLWKTVSRSNGTLKHYLFGCLPFWKRVVRGDGISRHYLFSFIPICSYKATRC